MREGGGGGGESLTGGERGRKEHVDMEGRE